MALLDQAKAINTEADLQSFLETAATKIDDLESKVGRYDNKKKTPPKDKQIKSSRNK